MDITQLQADTADMSRTATIGYLKRRPGNVEVMLDRLTHAPDGSPPNYAAAVDALAEYGAYLVAAAEVLRAK